VQGVSGRVCHPRPSFLPFHSLPPLSALAALRCDAGQVTAQLRTRPRSHQFPRWFGAGRTRAVAVVALVAPLRARFDVPGNHCQPSSAHFVALSATRKLPIAARPRLARLSRRLYRLFAALALRRSGTHSYNRSAKMTSGAVLQAFAASKGCCFLNGSPIDHSVAVRPGFAIAWA